MSIKLFLLVVSEHIIFNCIRNFFFLPPIIVLGIPLYICGGIIFIFISSSYFVFFIRFASASIRSMQQRFSMSRSLDPYLLHTIISVDLRVVSPSVSGRRGGFIYSIIIEYAKQLCVK